MYKNDATLEVKDTAVGNYALNTNQPNLLVHAYANSANVIGGNTGLFRLYDYVS